MSTELERFVDGSKNAENFEVIRNYLITLRDSGLATKPSWEPGEAARVQELTRAILPALPESIRAIKFPNGGQVIFGDKVDQVRTVEWDLMDIKKWAEHLGKSVKLGYLRTP